MMARFMMTLPQFQNRAIKAVPVWLVYVVGFLPAAWLIYSAFTGGLGFDPARRLEKEIGEYALKFLIVGLAITPLWHLTGINLAKYRRSIGLVGFGYVAIHLATYVGLDKQFDLGVIIEDIWKRPYITIGMAAFVLLLPLAITSNATMVKRLGTAAWKNVHKLVYVIVPMGALHFVMLTKTWQLEPMLYLATALLLLVLRHKAFDLRARPQRRPMPTNVHAGSLAP
jgi:methionine sulfoxide reductase heme-binding subunit